MDEREVIDGLRPVCICKGITKRAFLRLIASGLKTVEELQKATGAGTGPCKGKRCTLRIQELLQESEERPAQ